MFGMGHLPSSVYWAPSRHRNHEEGTVNKASPYYRIYRPPWQLVNENGASRKASWGRRHLTSVGSQAPAGARFLCCGAVLCLAPLVGRLSWREKLQMVLWERRVRLRPVSPGGGGAWLWGVEVCGVDRCGAISAQDGYRFHLHRRALPCNRTATFLR